jgi:MFS superfamily sulfate permease-like transporter
MYRAQIPNVKLPMHSSDLGGLPRELMVGIVVAIMGFVSVVIGTVLFGATSGIGAYIDNVFKNMGVQANITQTIKAFNFSTVFSLFGIAMLIVGFVIILIGLLRVGKEAQSLWRSQ